MQVYHIEFLEAVGQLEPLLLAILTEATSCHRDSNPGDDQTSSPFSTTQTATQIRIQRPL